MARQLVVQRLEAPAKVAGRRGAQQLRGAHLQLGPVGQGLASTRGGCSGGLLARRHLHGGDLAKVGVGHQHALQLREVGPVAVARLIGVHAQLAPPGDQPGQFFP